MELTANSLQYYAMLHTLSSLPQNLLLIYGRDNAAEFVLHELCKEHCFNLKKAAYLAHNPDFRCMRGVAGYTEQESYRECPCFWKKPDEFSEHMQSAVFNKKVRGVERVCKNDVCDVELCELAKELGMTNHGVCSWQLKNGNTGILLFERDVVGHEDDLEFLRKALAILGFCPIF